MHDQPSPYLAPGAVASYAADALRKVPGLTDLHRMTMLLLSEQAPAAAHMLVVGAGGGMESRALAEAQPGWRLTGVDPSPAMLDLARRTLAPFADRVALIEGTVDRAPDGLFDGATCLLTLHHLGHGERLHTLREVHRRLTPGARLVVAHHTAPGPDPRQWMTRSVAFGERNGADRATARERSGAMMERLPLLDPAQEEALLREAGFVDVALFYAALSFRGWVASAGTAGNDLGPT